MNKRLISKFTFAIIFSFFLFFVKTETASAQSCGTKEVKYNEYKCVFVDDEYGCEIIETTRQMGCACTNGGCYGQIHRATSCKATATGCSTVVDSYFEECNSTSCNPPTNSPSPSPTSGNWGACGGCNCGHTGQCRIDPTGACVWDPSGCGGGGGSKCTWTDGACVGEGESASACRTDPSNPAYPACNCCPSTLMEGPNGACVCAPRCTVTNNLTSATSIDQGSSVPIRAYPVSQLGNITGVTFNQLQPTPLTTPATRVLTFGASKVNSLNDTSSPYQTFINGNLPVSARVRMVASVTSDGATTTCTTNSARITVNPPPALPGWWQTRGGDTVARGGVFSLVPTSGDDLILDNSFGYPGILLYTGSQILGSGGVSSEGWAADSTMDDKTIMLTHNYLLSLVSSDATKNTTTQGTLVSSLSSGGTVSPGGYHYFVYDGDLTLPSQLNISGGRKVVLFVNGDFTINGAIRLQNPNVDFFMVVASGDISVDPLVTNVVYGSPTSRTLSLEGIYFTQGRFSSGVSATQLSVRGIVAAGSVLLSRDLGVTNNTTPAESFEFSEEAFALYPTELDPKKLTWVEVAP